MDQDRELFKLQVAVQHYESNMDRGYNYLAAYFVGVLVLLLGGAFSKQLSWNDVVLVSSGNAALVATLIWWASGRYNHKIEKLDQYLQNLEKGRVVPSLTELAKE
jgi:membrane protein DedA with SNARE-associated domain